MIQSKLGSLTVINGKQYGFLGKNKIYIGRDNPHPKYNLIGSILANPYHVGKDGTREQVIAKYRVWLWERIQEKGVVYHELLEVALRIIAGNNLILTCYCKPLDCHGDVVKRAIEWMICEIIKQQENQQCKQQNQ